MSEFRQLNLVTEGHCRSDQSLLVATRYLSDFHSGALSNGEFHDVFGIALGLQGFRVYRATRHLTGSYMNPRKQDRVSHYSKELAPPGVPVYLYIGVKHPTAQQISFG